MTLMLLASCETPFSLDPGNVEPKIYAFCVPGAEDTTSIIIEIARPVGSSKEYDRSKAVVDFRINEEIQEVFFNKGYEHKNLPKDCFYVTRKMFPGDKVSLEVSLEGVRSVSSSTIVPDYPQETDFVIKMKEGRRSDFIVSYADDSDDTYYAAVFYQKRREYNESHDYEYIFYDVKFSGYEFDPFMSSPELVMNAMNNGNGLYFWKNSDAREKDGKKVVTFSEYITEDVKYGEHSGADYSYEARIYRMTEELYNYYYSENVAGENYFNDFGMSRNNPVYTNIAGGFGILGGMASRSHVFDTTSQEDDRYLPEVQ